MFVGTENVTKGVSVCAPKGDNSVNFYAKFPSPSHHIIDDSVGHMDMIVSADIFACDLVCSFYVGSSDSTLNKKFIN